MGKIFVMFTKIANLLSRKGVTRIPGMLNLYYFLYRKMRPSAVLINVEGNKLYVNCKDEGVVINLLVHGSHEKYETELFKKIVKPGMTVVDIGANFGYYTLLAAKLVGGQGKVYAFEPELNNFELLLRNIKINEYDNIVPVKKAISDETGQIKLFTDEYNLAAASFSEKNMPVQKSGFEEVDKIRLDDFFNQGTHIDFMKIDVQGAEGLLVDGAKNLLKKNDLKILIEFWPTGLKNLGTEPMQFLEKLKNFGFNIQCVDELESKVYSVTPEEIIKLCHKKDYYRGGGFVNLLLEK